MKCHYDVIYIFRVITIVSCMQILQSHLLVDAQMSSIVTKGKSIRRNDFAISSSTRDDALIHHQQHHQQQRKLQTSSSTAAPTGEGSKATVLDKFLDWFKEFRSKNPNFVIETTPISPTKVVLTPIASPTIATSAPTISPTTTLAPTDDDDVITDSTTDSVVAKHCTCNSCTDDVWNTIAGFENDGYTCGDRISYLHKQETYLYPTENDACIFISEVEFPTECSLCNPKTCDDRSVPVERTPTYHCGCPTCTENTTWLNGMTDGNLSCAARIIWVQNNVIEVNQNEIQACRFVANQFPTICGPSCHPDICTQSTTTTNTTVIEAPTKVPVPVPVPLFAITKAPTAQVPPTVSAPIRATATPTGIKKVIPTVSPVTTQPSNTADLPPPAESGIPPVPASPTKQPLSTVYIPPPEGSGMPPVHTSPTKQPSNSVNIPPPVESGIPPADTTPITTMPQNLYCFPPEGYRKGWTDVWGKYIVEVKESEGVCGPGNNKFTRNTVSLNDEKDELTLQFKMDNGVWTGSEVRVLLPAIEMPFRYGTFQFSVKSIVVKDVDGIVHTSNDLPPSLVLGLFTWDDTDDYSIHENFSHEVDIEISRWNNATASDGQFLVQPPGQPQMYRFSTGSVPNTRNPAGHAYEFSWLPGAVYWSTTAGGGQNHSYTTAQAVATNIVDHVQCLPANVEIRMNLWNFLNTQTPTELLDTDIVEVVIDNFTYIPTPLSVTGIIDGKTCTKDCQCKPESFCSNQVCIARNP